VLAININTALNNCQRNRTTLVVKVAMKPSSERIEYRADQALRTSGKDDAEVRRSRTTM